MMIKKLVSSFMVLFSFGSLGAIEENFHFGSLQVKFWSYKKERITVSPECLKPKCEDLLILGSISIVKIREELNGGVNPGSAICKYTLGGVVILGVDKNKNENSFCKLNNLIIDNGTLTYYATLNDKN